MREKLRSQRETVISLPKLWDSWQNRETWQVCAYAVSLIIFTLYINLSISMLLLFIVDAWWNQHSKIPNGALQLFFFHFFDFSYPSTCKFIINLTRISCNPCSFFFFHMFLTDEMLVSWYCSTKSFTAYITLQWYLPRTHSHSSQFSPVII